MLNGNEEAGEGK